MTLQYDCFKLWYVVLLLTVASNQFLVVYLEKRNLLRNSKVKYT